MSPLEGITVVSLEQAVAAPFATRQLADLGARVIKLERPGVGDFARHYDTTVNGESSFFVWLNRSKESLTLNLKHDRARGILSRLLARADVFVQNLSPGAVGRLGFGSEMLRENYPELIICNLSGYGESGPYRNKKAYDLLIQAESGLLSVTGTPETPCKAGISAADIAAGMYAYSSVLTALFARERTGKGTRIEISMLEALGEWMSYPMYYARYGGSAPRRTGNRHATIAPYGPFATRKGDLLLIGIQNEREFERFCTHILSEAELARDQRFMSNANRVIHRDELEKLIQKAFGALTLEQATALLDEHQIAYGQMRDMQHFAAHPQLGARERWQQIKTPGGMVDALLPPPVIEDVDYRMDPVPAIGEHTETILREIGLDNETIQALRVERSI